RHRRYPSALIAISPSATDHVRTRPFISGGRRPRTGAIAPRTAGTRANGIRSGAPGTAPHSDQTAELVIGLTGWMLLRSMASVARERPLRYARCRMAELRRSITGLLTPGVIQRAALLVRENVADTERTLAGRAVPAVLARLATLASSGTGAERVRELVERATEGRNPLADLGALFAGGAATEDGLRAGRDQLHAMFGDRVDAVVSELASAGGVQNASASSLLGLATPIVLAALAGECSARGLDQSGLTRLLAGEQRTIGGLLTPGLNGLVRAADTGPLSTRPVATRPPPTEPPAWRMPLLVVALVGLLGAVFLTLWRGFEPESPPAPRPQ